eukprot:9475079-Pyramimonas_sp.AAC.1
MTTTTITEYSYEYYCIYVIPVLTSITKRYHYDSYYHYQEPVRLHFRLNTTTGATTATTTTTTISTTATTISTTTAATTTATTTTTMTTITPTTITRTTTAAI